MSLKIRCNSQSYMQAEIALQTTWNKTEWFQFKILIHPDITILGEWVWNMSLLTFYFLNRFFLDKTSMRRFDMDKIFVHLPLFQKKGFWIDWYQKSLSKSQLHWIGCGITFSTVPFLSATRPKRNITLKATDAEQNGRITFNCSKATCPKRSHCKRC